MMRLSMSSLLDTKHKGDSRKMSSTLDINNAELWNDSPRACDAVERWVSVGYNFLGFPDQDFSAGRYTGKGVFLRSLMKFDQRSLHDLYRHRCRPRVGS